MNRDQDQVLLSSKLNIRIKNPPDSAIRTALVGEFARTQSFFVLEDCCHLIPIDNLTQQRAINIALLQRLILPPLTQNIPRILHPPIKQVHICLILLITECVGQFDVVVVEDVGQDEKVGVGFVDRNEDDPVLRGNQLFDAVDALFVDVEA